MLGIHTPGGGQACSSYTKVVHVEPPSRRGTAESASAKLAKRTREGKTARPAAGYLFEAKHSCVAGGRHKVARTALGCIRGPDEIVHIFRRCGFTKALLCIPVMSPLHRSELLVCTQCGSALVSWFGRTDHAPTVALEHRRSIAFVAVVGMVDEVLRASMCSEGRGGHRLCCLASLTVKVTTADW